MTGKNLLTTKNYIHQFATFGVSHEGNTFLGCQGKHKICAKKCSCKCKITTYRKTSLCRNVQFRKGNSWRCIARELKQRSFKIFGWSKVHPVGTSKSQVHLLFMFSILTKAMLLNVCYDSVNFTGVLYLIMEKSLYVVRASSCICNLIFFGFRYHSTAQSNKYYKWIQKLYHSSIKGVGIRMLQ